MCVTLERADGTTVAETVDELINFLGSEDKIVFYDNDTIADVHRDSCLCQIDLDKTIKENSIDAKLDESCMYYVLKS